MNVSTARKIKSKTVISMADVSAWHQAKAIVRKDRKRRKAHAKRTSGNRR